jgi:translation initiation factor 6
MESVKCNIKGSDYVGVFATATDNFVFVGSSIGAKSKEFIAKALGARMVELSLSGSDLIGLFSRANSNGIVLSNLVQDEEVQAVKGMGLGINVAVIDSDLNAIGNNILANDKIAMVNIDYEPKAVKQIGDALGVEVVKVRVGNFKTVGANDIMTNKGFVVSNRIMDADKKRIDEITGFDSTRTTANTGSLYVGLAAIANSKGVVVGESTTGYELARIVDGLEQ